MRLEGNQTHTELTSDCPYFSRIWFETNGIGLDVLNCFLNVPSAIGATLLNGLVMVSIWSTRSLHQPSFMLLFSLALSDFLVGAVVQPGFVASIIARLQRAPSVQCVLLIVDSVTTSTLCSVSLLTMTAISIDRYLAIRLHLRYRAIVYSRRVLFVLVFIWLACAAVGNSFVWDETMISVASIATLTVSNAIALFTYAKINRAVRRHETQIGAAWCSRRNERFPDINRQAAMGQCKKSVITMFLVHCLFVCCFMPYFCITIALLVSEHTPAKHSALEFSLTLVLINSCLNPLVYCWRLAEIRQAMRLTASKISVCQHISCKVKLRA